MNNKTTIIAITTLVIIASGLIAIPSVDQHQAHASLLKDSANKVKNFVKHVVGKIFHRDNSGGCGTCG